MKNQIKKTSFLSASLVMLLISFTFVSAQDKPDTTKHHMMMKDRHSMTHDKMQMKDSTMNMKHMDHEMKMDHMKKVDSSMNMNHMNHEMKMDHMKNDDSTKKTNHEMSSIVREGVIDLQSIDENKDGKVFQDQMDWNAISDKPGKCPLCKMTLKEVTLSGAKKNLKENGFKVK